MLENIYFKISDISKFEGQLEAMIGFSKAIPLVSANY